MADTRWVLGRLTAPDMHGRGYVNRGDSIAAAFIAHRFDSLGLKPFGNSYMQPFPMSVNTFPGNVKLKAGREDLQPGADFIVGAASPSAMGKAKTFMLDTAVFTSEKARNIFLATPLRGKAPVYFARFAGRIRENEEVQAHLQSAAAIVEIHDKLTHTISPKTDSMPVFKVLRSKWDRKTSNITFEIKAQLIPRYMSQNVLGWVSGSTKPDSFVVLTAHYDHLGRMGQATYFPGANDNASGTTMLLALAAYYSRPENRPECSIAFMAFGGEEAGLVGSRFYTEHARFPLSSIRFLVNMDLMGTGDEGINTVNGTLYPKSFSRLQELNNIYKSVPVVKSRGRAANSDHYWFSENDVPAFFIYTMGGPQFYHDVNDRAETLPLTKFRELYSLIIAFVEDVQQR
ncbi:MAG: M28 family peptidase [Bacteroidota bacterium]